MPGRLRQRSRVQRRVLCTDSATQTMQSDSNPPPECDIYTMFRNLAGQGRICSFRCDSKKGKVIYTLKLRGRASQGLESAHPASEGRGVSAEPGSRMQQNVIPASGPKLSGRRLKSLLTYQARLCVERDLPPSRLMTIHKSLIPDKQAPGNDNRRCGTRMQGCDDNTSNRQFSITQVPSNIESSEEFRMSQLDGSGEHVDKNNVNFQTVKISSAEHDMSRKPSDPVSREKEWKEMFVDIWLDGLAMISERKGILLGKIYESILEDDLEDDVNFARSLNSVRINF